MNSGFEFKAPSVRTLGSKLAERQARGSEKPMESPAYRPFRSSTAVIFKKKSTLGRRRTLFFKSPNVASTPSQNLNPRPSCSSKKSPAWASTPGPDHSRFFESGISQLGTWSVFKKGPPLDGVRTPVSNSKLPQRTSKPKQPLVKTSESSDCESDEETKQKLKELDNIPLSKNVFPSILRADKSQNVAESNCVESPVIGELGGLKRHSSPQLSRRVTFSPSASVPQSKQNVRACDTIESKKRDVSGRLNAKLCEFRELAKKTETLCSEIIELQDEMDRLNRCLTVPKITISPYNPKENVENESSLHVKENWDEEGEVAAYKHLAYTPRSLTKVYRAQFHDIFNNDEI